MARLLQYYLYSCWPVAVVSAPHLPNIYCREKQSAPWAGFLMLMYILVSQWTKLYLYNTADKKQISDLVSVNAIIFRLVLYHSCRKFKNTLIKIIFLTLVGTICWNIDPVENTRPSMLQESSKPQSIIWHWLRPFNRRAKLYEKHFGSSWQDWMQVIQSMSYEER